MGGEVEIGEGTTLYPGRGDRRPVPDRRRLARSIPTRCSIADVVLGDRVEVHAGTVLGGDGFGYRQVDGRHVKVPHTGRLEVGSDVEIGSNCSIDRATFEATRIGEGTKIDNLVMIGHNNQIGRHNLLCGQVGIAGSCTHRRLRGHGRSGGNQGQDPDRRRGDRGGAGRSPSQHSQPVSTSWERRRSRSESSGGSSR